MYALVVCLEQLVERFCMKLIVTKIQRGIDRLKGLKVYIDFALLAVLCEHCARVDHQAVWGHLQQTQTPSDI